MSKAIEEIKVSGTYEEEPVNGKVFLYTDALNKAKGLGIRTSVIEPFISSVKKVANEINPFDKITNFVIENPELAKRVAAFGIATFVLTSLVGCKKGAAELTSVEPTYTVAYTVVAGDSYWDIASRYNETNAEIQEEISKICLVNDKDFREKLQIGTKLTLAGVPESCLESLGYAIEYTPVSEEAERDAKFDFLWGIIDSDPSIHPENYVYADNIEELAGILNEARAASGKYYTAKTDLDIMEDESHFYTPEQIKEQEKLVDGYKYTLNYYLDAAIEKAEKKFGKKYKPLEATANVVPIAQQEKGLTK